jgi:hypothetical protein
MTEVDLLHAVPTTISTSTAYRDDVAQVGRLVDGDLESAWNSATENLAGAFIDIEVPRDATVTAIALTAGFPKVGENGDLFTGNHRVRHVRVARDGVLVREQDLDIEDRGLQRIELPAGTMGGVFRVELSDLAPGTRTRWREACVSEIQVMGSAPAARAGVVAPTSRIGAIEVPTVAAAGTEPLGDEGIADDELGDEGMEDEDPNIGGGAPSAAGAGTDPAAGPEIIVREGLHLTELVLARGIESRRPLDPGHTFSKASDDKIYCYVRVANPDREETAVYIGWEPVDQPTEDPGREQTVQASPEWVTFSFTGTRRRAGRYRCVVRDTGGEVLGRAAFDLTE